MGEVEEEKSAGAGIRAEIAQRGRGGATEEGVSRIPENN